MYSFEGALPPQTPPTEEFFSESFDPERESVPAKESKNNLFSDTAIVYWF
jgi:hypothetical protein